MSDGAWVESLERHKKRLGSETYAVVVQTLYYKTFTSNFDKLVASYSSRKFTTCLQKLKGVFDSLQTFTLVIGTMVSSNPCVAALVWGSVLAIIELARRFMVTLEKITEILGEITASLPGFERYLKLFPESKAIEAKARELYDSYIDFLIDIRQYLLANPLRNIVTSLWPGSRVHKGITAAEERIRLLSIQFDKEVRLTTDETTIAGSRMLLNTASNTPTPSTQRTTVTLPQNEKFFGQVSRLKELHSAVGPQVSQPQSGQASKRQRSCCLHGIGGSRKTSIALEYLYRYQYCFRHVFWVTSERSAELADSYARIAKVVLPSGPEKSMNQEQLIRQAKDWVSSTEDTWLLVFDNVVKSDMLLPYIPCSTHGSIIITSQSAEIQDMTTSSIHIQGFADDQEAVNLLLHYLQNKNVDREHARAVIDLIGEIPLAIAHAAGVVNQIGCTLPKFIATIKKRSQRSAIWSVDKPATILHYERSFGAVFNIALETLSPGVRDLLECLAFLDPNGIPEDMIFPSAFETLSLDPNLGELEIKKQLKSQYLVKTQITNPMLASVNQSSFGATGVPAFLVHRTVQQILLFELDETPDKRQERFEQSFELVRAVVPRQSPYRVPINHLWPIYEKYITNVRSLYYNFVSPEQPLRPVLGFAELLSDTCNYLWEKNEPRGAMDMLQTAEGICNEVLDPDDPNPILSGLLAVIASFELNAGPDSRASCLGHMKRVLDLRRRHVENIPRDSAKMEDGLLLGSGYNNLAWAYMTMDEFEKADPLLQVSFDVKTEWANEKTAVFPFAEYYKNIAHVELTRRNSERAIHLMSKARNMMKQSMGPGVGSTMLFSFILGNMLFCVGEFEKALVEHLRTLKLRIENLSSTDPYVLDSYHAVGVIYHELGQLEPAAFHLSKALEERFSWYPMNVARSLYRLSLVQRDQGQLEVARKNREEARQLRDTLEIAKENKLPFNLGTEDGEIACFDYLVPLASGRMFGSMNVGCK